jgi:hypothetical protein
MEPDIAAFLLACIDKDKERRPRTGFGSRTSATVRRAALDGYAKRDIVRLHEVMTDPETGRRVCSECKHDFPCQTLRILASSYTAFPDYQQEWRV